jgi:hypothetical protein
VPRYVRNIDVAKQWSEITRERHLGICNVAYLIHCAAANHPAKVRELIQQIAVRPTLSSVTLPFV